MLAGPNLPINHNNLRHLWGQLAPERRNRTGNSSTRIREFDFSCNGSEH